MISVPSDIRPLVQSARFKLLLAVVPFLVLVGGTIWFISSRIVVPNESLSESSPTATQGIDELDINEFLNLSNAQLDISSEGRLIVNGELKANGAFILEASEEPANAQPGQVFFSSDTGEIKFYDGTEFKEINTQTIDGEICFIGAANCGFATQADVDLATVPLAVDVNSLNNNGVVLGSGTGQIRATSAPSAGQLLIGSAAGTPTFASLSGDATLSSAGSLSISAGVVGSTQLASTSVSAGSYGSASDIPIVTVDEDGRVTAASSVPLAFSGVTSLNGLTSTAQTFTTGTAGSDFAINSSGSVHTFDLPDAGAAARGLVSTGAQTFNGAKTFADAVTASGGLTVQTGQTLTVNGAAVSNLVGTGLLLSSGALQTVLGTTVDLASEVTGVLPVASGGTGGATAAVARANLNAAESGANADITGMTVLTSITPSATLTIGTATETLSLLGNASSGLFVSDSGNTTSIGFATPTADTTITFPAHSAGLYDVCTTAGNCLGGGSGGANTSLSNLTSVAINTTLLPGVAGGIDLGSSSLPFRDLYLAGSSGSPATDNFTITGSLTGPQTITLPDASGTVCLSIGNCIGGAGGASNAAAYLTVGSDAGLTAERAITAGTNLTATDGGANSTFTFDVVNNPTFTGLLTADGGLTLGASDILTINGDAFTDLTGTGLEISSGSLQVDSTVTQLGSSIQDSEVDDDLTISATGSVDDGALSTNVSLLGAAIDLASEVAGTLPIANGGTGATTAQGAINNISGLTANGDLLYHDGANTTRLPRGVTNQCLLSTATSLQWGSCTAGGGITSLNGLTSAAQVFADDTNVTITSAGSTHTLGWAGQLAVSRGGIGASTLTSNGVLFGNGTGAVQATAAGTGGQLLIANGSGVPTFATLSGDATLSDTGVLSIAADAVALGADTTGDYVSTLTSGNGISATASGEGSTPTIALGALTANWDQTGAFDISLNNASSELRILESAGATFFGVLDVADLTADITLTIADGSTGDICTSAGNCLGGGGGSAPNGASYITVGNNATLTAERAITAGTNLTATDGGANSTFTFDVVNNPTFTGLLTADGGLTLGASDILTINGDAFTDLTGTGLQFNAGALETVLGTSVDLTSEVTGTLPIANGGTGATTAQGAIDSISGLTTNGDLLYHDGTNATRLGRGATNECLTSTATTIQWATCFGSGSGGTLQAAYDAGNSITTTDNRRIDFTLADTATPSDFTVTMEASNMIVFRRENNASSSDPGSLLSLENLDTDLSINDGLRVTDAGGTLIDGVDVSSATITNAINIGGNAIAGTNFSVTAAGDTTANSLTLTVLGAASNNSFLCYNGSNQVASCAASPLFGDMVDNTDDALDIQQGSDDYINISTINSSENISFGNATINPSYDFLGSGTLTVAGATTLQDTVTIGVSDATGTLLTVDTKTSAGDPTGVNGSIYYNGSSNLFRCFENSAWVDCLGNESGFTSPAGLTYLLNTSDNVTLGSTSAGGKLFIDGADDEIQLQVRANATQTNNLLVIEDDAGVDLAWFDDGGNLSVSTTGPDAAGGSAIDVSTTLRSTTNAQNGLQVQAFVSPVSAPAGNFHGTDTLVTSGVASLGTSSLVGTYSVAQYGGSGTADLLIGGQFIGRLQSIGNSASTVQGARAKVEHNGSGTLADAFALDVVNTTIGGGGTVGNNYGARVRAQTVGTNNAGIVVGETTGTRAVNLLLGETIIGNMAVGDFSIYNVSTNDNYFAGNLGIGRNNPGAKLDLDEATSSSDVDILRVISDVGGADTVVLSVDSDGDILSNGSLDVTDAHGVVFGSDDDATLAYDEVGENRIELTGTNASLFIEDKVGFGRQTFTMSTAGAATENLTVSASYIEITGQDNAADIAAIQTTGAQEGDFVVITNTSATDVSIDQNATTKLSGGGDVLLTQYDVITLIFDGTNWLQAAAVTDNS